MGEGCDCSFAKRLLKKKKNPPSAFTHSLAFSMNKKGKSLREVVLFYWKKTKVKWETPKEDNAVYI